MKTANQILQHIKRMSNDAAGELEDCPRMSDERHRDLLATIATLDRLQRWIVAPAQFDHDAFGSSDKEVGL